MIAFLLTNWKVILTGCLVSLLSWGLHTLDVYRLEDKQRTELAEQAKVLNNSCNADKAITEGVSNDYQKKLADLGRQLDAVKRVQPTRCIPVSAPRPACGSNAKTGANQPVDQNGVTSDALYSLAGEAERYRLQLIACQDFIAETWAKNGQ